MLLNYALHPEGEGQRRFQIGGRMLDCDLADQLARREDAISIVSDIVAMEVLDELVLKRPAMFGRYFAASQLQHESHRVRAGGTQGPSLARCKPGRSAQLGYVPLVIPCTARPQRDLLAPFKHVQSRYQLRGFLGWKLIR